MRASQIIAAKKELDAKKAVDQGNFRIKLDPKRSGRDMANESYQKLNSYDNLKVKGFSAENDSQEVGSSYRSREDFQKNVSKGASIEDLRDMVSQTKHKVDPKKKYAQFTQSETASRLYAPPKDVFDPEIKMTGYRFQNQAKTMNLPSGFSGSKVYQGIQHSSQFDEYKEFVSPHMNSKSIYPDQLSSNENTKIVGIEL
jgi:hypothetical protein